MQLISVQILRAIAALAVTFGHAQGFIGVPLEKMGRSFEWNHFLPWSAGVDLFFAISGFIMVYSSERLFASPEAGRVFLSRRVARIVPLYWCALVLVLAGNALRHKAQPDIVAAVTSFLFIPYDALHKSEPRPFYELGWTLNYEMFFYAIFALFVALPRFRAVAASTAALVTLIALGTVFKFANPVLHVWTQAIMLEFVFGMAIALLARLGFALPRGLQYSLVAVAIAMLSIDFLDSPNQPRSWVEPNDFSRVFAWGIPGAMLLSAAVLAPRDPTTPGAAMRVFAAVGDASYALYLFHPIVLSPFSAAWYRMGIDHYLPPQAGIAVGVLISIVMALVIYNRFERPMTRYLQSRWQTPQTQLGVAA